jgi:hypothetical protein
MHHFSLRVAFAVCLLAVMQLCGCQQPGSGTDYKPEVTGRTRGYFSYDITLTLNSVNRIDSSRDESGVITSQKTPVDGTLRDVQLKVTVRYAQGPPHETQAFDANWQVGGEIVVNVPAQSKLQGYDVSGTSNLYNAFDQFVATVPINLAFRVPTE